MRPICCNCQREMNVIKNEVLVSDIVSSKDPFQTTYRYGDLFSCPSCGYKIVTGFGRPLTDIEKPKDTTDIIKYSTS